MAAILTVLPSAALADTITGDDSANVLSGTTGSDDIDAAGGDDTVSGDGDTAPGSTLNGSHDTISGGSGDDTIYGDGNTGNVDSGGFIFGGDDTIDSGDGNDTIYGDGIATGNASVDGAVYGGVDSIDGGDGNDTIYGDGIADGVLDSVYGGRDLIHGGDGNDTIYGDGGKGFVVGGDDDLYGGDGDDHLFGQSGNDFLCGGEGDDELVGGAGIDLACAVDDVVAGAAGKALAVALAANDEHLDDEADEAGLPLMWFLDQVSAGITVLSLDKDTGDISLTACQSGYVGYRATREGTPLSAYGFLTVTVTGSCVPANNPTAADPGSATAAGAANVSDTALLPDTGASSNLRMLAVIAMGLMTSGVALIIAARPRRIAVVL